MRKYRHEGMAEKVLQRTEGALDENADTLLEAVSRSSKTLMVTFLGYVTKTRRVGQLHSNI